MKIDNVNHEDLDKIVRETLLEDSDDDYDYDKLTIPIPFHDFLAFNGKRPNSTKLLST
jgi:hypothetical protein